MRIAAPAAQPIRPPVTRAGALKAREELEVWLRRRDGLFEALGAFDVMFCCFSWLALTLFDRFLVAIDVDDGSAVVAFLLCIAGRSGVVSLKTDGALSCRVTFAGTAVVLLLGEMRSFEVSMLVLVFALSALRRAGFFLGFLAGVAPAGCALAVAFLASIETAILID